MENLYPHVKLTIIQMVRVGMHVGHTIRSSIFLAYWMFGGERYSMFIIDLIKSKLLLRRVIEYVIKTVYQLMPFWFINTSLGFGEHIYKYALLCGEPFCIYKWTNGCITNVEVLSSWNWILLDLLNTNKYKLRFRDKKQILNFTGFWYNRWKEPGLGFISRPAESYHILQEFDSKQIDYLLIIDSNVNSKGYLFPIPGNDDSILCLNFYCFFFAFIVIKTKILHFSKFEEHVYDDVDFRFLSFNNKLLNLYLLKKRSHASYFDSNNKIINSLFKIINNNFLSINWITTVWQHSLLNAQTKPSVVAFIGSEFADVRNILREEPFDTYDQQLKYPNAFDPFIIL